MITIQAIIPRGKVPLDPSKVSSGVNRWLRDFSFEVIREMQEYPPWRPWKNPPRSGPRKGGRRTGAYGKGWGSSVTFTPNSVTIRNRVGYAVHVGGPRSGERGRRQAAAMRARGWKSVTDVAPPIAKRMAPVLIRRIAGGV